MLVSIAETSLPLCGVSCLKIPRCGNFVKVLILWIIVFESMEIQEIFPARAILGYANAIRMARNAGESRQCRVAAIHVIELRVKPGSVVDAGSPTVAAIPAFVLRTA